MLSPRLNKYWYTYPPVWFYLCALLIK